MQKFTKLTSVAAPLPMINIDTDCIIPKQFLKTILRTGLGKHLFYELRYDEQGKEKPDFVLNKPAYRRAQILVAGENFGCGSSREHAVWALTDYGFGAVVSVSFGDIFRQNALKSGLLPVVVPAAIHQRLLAAAGEEVVVDVAAAELRLADGTVTSFPLDPFARHCLLHGIDELGYLLAQDPAIARFEEARR